MTSRRSCFEPINVTGSAILGSPKERRLEPQLTIGLLTDSSDRSQPSRLEPL